MQGTINTVKKIVAIPLVLSLAFLSLLLNTPKAHAALEISDGSVRALYHLESDGTDSSGNGFNLNASGTITYGAAKVSNGATFDNTNYEWLSNGTVLADQTYSQCFWTGGLDLTDGGTFIGHATTSVDNNEIDHAATTGAVRHYDGTLLTSGASVSSTGPSFICQTKNGAAGVRMFRINNVDRNAAASTDQAPVNIILGNYGGGDNPLSGWLDEVILFNTVIASSTMVNLWNDGAGVSVCVTAGCADATTTDSQVIIISMKSENPVSV